MLAEDVSYFGVARGLQRRGLSTAVLRRGPGLRRAVVAKQGYDDGVDGLPEVASRICREFHRPDRLLFLSVVTLW